MHLTNEVIPDAALSALLLEVEPAPPGAEATARVLRRVRVRLDEAASIITVRRDDAWTPFFSGAERKILFDDGVTMSWLMRLAPGVRLPKHDHHAGPEECIVLEGDMWHEGERFGPGDYIVALPGTTHQETHTENGAVLFFRTPSPKATWISA